MIFGPRLTARHVLRSDDPRGQVERYADGRGWPVIAGAEADPDAGSEYERIWLTPTSLTLHYVEDLSSGQGYVFLAGDDRAALPVLEADLLDSVATWSWPDLVAAVSGLNWGPDRARALMRAAVAAPAEVDNDLAFLVEEAFRADDPDLRKVAVLAASYPAWPRFRGPLRRLADDPDPEVRDLASAALAAFDREGVPDS